MLKLLVRIVIIIGAGTLWFAGLRVFLQSGLSRTKKAGWTMSLVLVGIAIGVVLPLSQLWSKFLLLIVVLPVLGFADVWLLRSGRGLSFWLRGCGFEVCTVFAVAAATRFLLDRAGAVAFVPAVS